MGGDLVAEEEDRDISGVCLLDLEGEEDWRESVDLCRGVRSGAEDRGTAGIGGCDSVGMAVTGSGAICGVVSMARDPRTVEMMAVASTVGDGGAGGVASARVADSDKGVEIGGGVDVVGGVEAGAAAASAAAAARSATGSASRRAVPLIGRVSTRWPSLRRNSSGELDRILRAPWSR